MYIYLYGQNYFSLIEIIINNVTQGVKNDLRWEEKPHF